MGVIDDDPFSEIKPDKRSPDESLSPRQVARVHARSDVDSSTQSQHHTLGIKHTQGSYGDHNHDGKSSRKLGQGLNLTLTGAKGGNVALTNLIALLKNVIEFTDNTT